MKWGRGGEGSDEEDTTISDSFSQMIPICLKIENVRNYTPEKSMHLIHVLILNN